MRQASEKQNIEVNSRMVRNLLAAVPPGGSVEHVALVTGLNHYLGLFEMYGKGSIPATPFREDQDRLPIDNFYYAQEDEVFAAAEQHGFGWSVHRPHTINRNTHNNTKNKKKTKTNNTNQSHKNGWPFV